jgi:hypothetical protein
MTDTSRTSFLKTIYDSILRYAKLSLDGARLGLAEKLTILLSTVAFFAVVFVVALVALIFLSIGIGHILASTIAPLWAYVFIALFYLVLIAVLVAFKKQIFINPIARFITRLIVTPPKHNDDERK